MAETKEQTLTEKQKELQELLERSKRIHNSETSVVPVKDTRGQLIEKLAEAKKLAKTNKTVETPAEEKYFDYFKDSNVASVHEDKKGKVFAIELKSGEMLSPAAYKLKKTANKAKETTAKTTATKPEKEVVKPKEPKTTTAKKADPKNAMAVHDIEAKAQQTHAERVEKMASIKHPEKKIFLSTESKNAYKKQKAQEAEKLVKKAREAEVAKTTAKSSTTQNTKTTSKTTTATKAKASTNKTPTVNKAKEAPKNSGIKSTASNATKNAAEKTTKKPTARQESKTKLVMGAQNVKIDQTQTHADSVEKMTSIKHPDKKIFLSTDSALAHKKQKQQELKKTVKKSQETEAADEKKLAKTKTSTTAKTKVATTKTKPTAEKAKSVSKPKITSVTTVKPVQVTKKTRTTTKPKASKTTIAEALPVYNLAELEGAPIAEDVVTVRRKQPAAAERVNESSTTSQPVFDLTELQDAPIVEAAQPVVKPYFSETTQPTTLEMAEPTQVVSQIIAQPTPELAQLDPQAIVAEHPVQQSTATPEASIFAQDREISSQAAPQTDSLPTEASGFVSQQPIAEAQYSSVEPQPSEATLDNGGNGAPPVTPTTTLQTPPPANQPPQQQRPQSAPAKKEKSESKSEKKSKAKIVIPHALLAGMFATFLALSIFPAIGFVMQILAMVVAASWGALCLNETKPWTVLKQEYDEHKEAKTEKYFDKLKKEPLKTAEKAIEKDKKTMKDLEASIKKNEKLLEKNAKKQESFKKGLDEYALADYIADGEQYYQLCKADLENEKQISQIDERFKDISKELKNINASNSAEAQALNREKEALMAEKSALQNNRQRLAQQKSQNSASAVQKEYVEEKADLDIKLAEERPKYEVLKEKFKNKKIDLVLEKERSKYLDGKQTSLNPFEEFHLDSLEQQKPSQAYSVRFDGQDRSDAQQRDRESGR